MKDDNCIFCKIAAGEIPSVTVYEDAYFKAILDIAPAACGHTIIIPKDHFKDTTEITEEYSSRILTVATKIGKAQTAALGADGFNVLQNNGRAAGQSVFHYHMHVIPRKEGDGVIEQWKTGSPTADELAETARIIGSNM